jgi:TFIIF-interacting CTD phosphatase-like protein
MSTKPRVILDLDQTMISAEAEDEYDSAKNKDKASKFPHKELKEGDEVFYTVFERPGLQKFLDFLFSNFIVSIWTAASKDYALFIIEKFILAGKSDRHVDWIFFSYHCDISKSIKNGTKDLSIMWDEYNIPEYSKDNTVIIDDYNEVHKTQPDNCIIAAPFEFTDEGSENDTYFARLQPEMVLMKKSIKSKKGKPAENVNKAMGSNS